MKAKALRIIFWVLLVLGVVSLCSGIVIPLFFNNLIDEGLKDLWLKPDSYKSWTQIPGPSGIKIVRAFKLFNITNSDEIQSGGTGRLIELPPATYQEYTEFYNWEYQNQSGFSFGHKEAEDFVAFNAKTTLYWLPNNTTDLPLTQSITSVNFLTYLTFYSFTHSPLPLYMIPALYDVVLALENDLYPMILAYSAWAKYLSDPAFAVPYLTSLGLDPATIMNDPVYGWGAWQTLKPWIVSLLDFNATGLSNSYETLQMHFQLDQLVDLIRSNSLLYELVQTIQTDMLQRYGTNNPTELGIGQWASGLLTENLPLDLGRLNIPGSPIPLPSFIQLNTSFTTFPEVHYLQLAVNPATYQDFSPQAPTLLQISNVYPRTNTHSLLNLNNLGVLFTAPAASAAVFGFTNPQQIQNIMVYLGSLIQTPVKGYGNYDGYSLFLAKLTTKSLVSSTVKLRNDAYWSVPTLLVFANFTAEGKDCVDWVGSAQVCSSAFGWTIARPGTWISFQIWVKAAFKGVSSQEFSLLSTVMPSSELEELLYQSADNLEAYVREAMTATSLAFACTKAFCSYEELFYQQWSSGSVTSQAPAAVYTIVPRSPSMHSWLPQNYLLPIEWSSYSSLPVLPLAASFLSYSGFLNPGLIRKYYNTYFQGDDLATQAAFSLPSVQYVEALYQYFKSVIPGLAFFRTLPYTSWLNGYYDPFVGFVAGMSIYEGGWPVLSPLFAVATNSTDGNKPANVVYSGRLDTKVTKNYYKIYNSTILNRYGASYDEYSPSMLNYGYLSVWPEDIAVRGGDGGNFGTEVSNKDILPVYVSAIYRAINLTYVKDTTYHGLDLSRFEVQNGTFNTSESVASNWMYNQNPNGYDGFLNLSTAFGGPTFINLQHCLLCAEEAQGMFEYYEYDPDNYPGERIYPSSADMAYAEVEPLTGAGVKVFLNFELRVGFYNDYFFKGFKEPVPGKGVYFPVYTLNRMAALTQSQVDEFFGNLKTIQEVTRILFIIGIIVGCAFIVAALIVGGLIYRKNKFGSWKSPRNTMVKKYKLLGKKTRKERKVNKDTDTENEME